MVKQADNETVSYQEYNVLIIDDDLSFGESLKEIITRSGFRCYQVKNSKEALEYVKIQSVHVLLVDCLLPGVNGLNLVRNLYENLTGEPYLFLMSGVFKDKQFINESIKNTKAKDFLIKPFDTKKFINKLKSLFSGVNEEKDGFNSLTRLYLQRSVGKKDIINIINESKGLHSFDIPWVLKLLSNSRACGCLNVTSTDGSVAGVGFSQGDIVRVDIKNKNSLLGLLLVEKGYLDRSSLEEALSKNANRKMLGRYLVEKNLISPHAIPTVLKDQLVWRLKQLITNSQVELKFVETKAITTIVTIEGGEFVKFLIEVIENIIRSNWLKTHYLPISQNTIVLNENLKDEIKKTLVFPYFLRIYSSIFSFLKRGTTLDEILTKNSSIENHILKLIHFMNVMGYITFKNTQKSLNVAYQVKRLEKLNLEFENKDYFQRLGVSRSAQEGDIRKAYFDLAKVLHPDKLSESSSNQVKELSKKVFSKIQIAYDSLRKEEKRKTYIEEIEARQSEKYMEADRLFEMSKSFILKGQYSRAKKELKQAISLNPESFEFKIYALWAEMKTTKNPGHNFISDIDKKLKLIPLDSRDLAAYYHVRGLYYKIKNDHEKAKKQFLAALSRDPNLISARREMAELKEKIDISKLFKGNLKDVVGLLFKK